MNPQILVDALKKVGYKDPEIIWSPLSGNMIVVHESMKHARTNKPLLWIVLEQFNIQYKERDEFYYKLDK